MTSLHKRGSPNLVACEVCLKEIPRSEAVVPEGREMVAFFCGLDCYEQWKNSNIAPDERAAPARRVGEREHAVEVEAQLGTPRSPVQDERTKRLVRRHPQRDEPVIDSVESNEIPPR